MKKRSIAAAAVLCAVMLLSACGAEKKEDKASIFETLETGTGSQQETAEKPAGKPVAQKEKQDADADVNTDGNADVSAETDAGVITEDQAYNAVINYNKAIGSGIDEEINSDGYSEYWDVSTNEDGKIVVLYRSYTAAQTFYYVDPVSGETYITELVPGIIDEEQATGETFNVRDYLTAQGQSDGEEAADAPSAPVEYETGDGFMGSFLLASDRDRIDTTNDYGVLYRVVYKAFIEGDELTACGSMDYRNTKDQDPVTITSDITHIFKVDDNTVYLKGGEEGTETVSKEEFAGYLDSRKDSGMYFEVEIKDGVVATAELYAQ